MKNILMQHKNLCPVCLTQYQEVFETIETHTHMIRYQKHSLKYLPNYIR